MKEGLVHGRYQRVSGKSRTERRESLAMTEMSEGELMGIFAEILEVDRGILSERSSPESVQGWDSAKSMEIVMSIEEAFGLEFNAGELVEMTSIGAIKQILTRRG